MSDGWVNLGRVYQKEGRIPEALAAPERAAKHEKPGCTLGHQLAERPDQCPQRSIGRSHSELSKPSFPPRSPGKIDLSLDYEVNNELAFAFYTRAMQESLTSPERLDYLKKAVAAYRRTLSIDSENVTAHHVLGLAYGTAPWGGEPGRCRGSRFSFARCQRTRAPTADALLNLAVAAVDSKAVGASTTAGGAAAGPRDHPIRGWPTPALSVAAGTTFRAGRDLEPRLGQGNRSRDVPH